ncbi:MAG: PBP1A family penicillin-binding protein [Rhodovibrionaceae bacterium]
MGGKSLPGGGPPKRRRKAKPASARKRPAGKARSTPQQGAPRGLARRIATWGLIVCIWGLVALTALVAFYAYDLPDVRSLAQETRRPGITLLAADDSQIASFGDLYGDSVTVDSLPSTLPDAVLAVEDRRFYAHPGVDPFGLLRAMWANVREGAVVQGGSTITQQLAKILFLTPERTLRRKVQEVLLAFWLEVEFGKDEILSLYLNRVYLGAGTYGVDAAARRYFGKPAAEVNLYESALLAGLLKAPSRYSPSRGEDAAESRTRVVLDTMVDAGFITRRQADYAIETRERGKTTVRWRARHFSDWVLAQVEDFIGRVDRDIVIKTTLDSRLQQIAETEAAEMLEGEASESDAGEAAVVLMDPGGALLAMVGGQNYAKSQFNRATQAQRQPGSAFKLFVFLTALEAGYTPDSRVVDGPVEIDGWSPGNYNDRYFGEVTLRDAFARSMNSVSARLTDEFGPARVAATAKRLGISSPLDETPALSLGVSEVSLLELTSAYAVLANGGRGVYPFGITEIRDKQGNVLYGRSGGGPGRLVQPREVSQINNLMTAVTTWGTGKGAAIGRPMAGKTGTSQDFRDAWFIGFTGNYVGGVWLGNDDNTPMDSVTGGGLPARLWANILSRASEGVPVAALPDPGGGAQPERQPQAQPSGGNQGGGQGKDSVIGRLLDKILGGGGGGGQGDNEAIERLPPSGGERER